MAQTGPTRSGRTVERRRCKVSEADMAAMRAEYLAAEEKRQLKGYRYVCDHCQASHVPGVLHDVA